jgi:hypothetical protein
VKNFVQTINDLQAELARETEKLRQLDDGQLHPAAVRHVAALHLADIKLATAAKILSEVHAATEPSLGSESVSPASVTPQL